MKKKRGKVRNSRVKVRRYKIKRVLFFLSLLAIVVVVCFMYYHQERQYDYLWAQKLELEQKIKQVEEKNREIISESERLKDRDYIEKIAREEYGLIKPWEKILIP